MVMGLMGFEFPDEVNRLFEVFELMGKELYLVGGSVRDILLKRPPVDYDFATNALPQEVMTYFDKTIPTGIDYGTVTVVIGNNAYEITTYRKDHDSDGRRPKSVSFSDHIEEDLKRRDFTMNAIAMDGQYNLLDYFGGIEDIQRKIIRFVGNPFERVKEDKLRLVRGIRFAAVYDFQILEDEYEGVYKRPEPHDLSLLSVERFQVELGKILVSKGPHVGLKMLEETQIMDSFIPELRFLVGYIQNTPHHHLDAWAHTLEVVKNTPAVLHIRLAALLHDIEKPSTYTVDEKGQGHFIGHEIASAATAVRIMKRLKYDMATTLKVEHLILLHMRKELPSKKSTMRRWIKEIGKENIVDLIDLMEADASVLDTTEYQSFRSQIKALLDMSPVLDREALAINGTDLIEAFGLSGKIIGLVLNNLLDQVIEEPELNQRETLMKLAEKQIKNGCTV